MGYKPIKCTRDRMRLKKTHARVFFDSFFAVRFMAKRCILQQKYLNGQIGTCLPGTRQYYF